MMGIEQKKWSERVWRTQANLGNAFTSRCFGKDEMAVSGMGSLWPPAVGGCNHGGGHVRHKRSGRENRHGHRVHVGKLV